MNEDRKRQVALFRLAVLGELVNTELRRGTLHRVLKEKAGQLWSCPDGRTRRIAAKTIQAWYYRYRNHGFDALAPGSRRDKGACRAIAPELQTLIVEMKTEDPGRSAPMIIRELEGAGRIARGRLSESTVGRLLARSGLSGPKMELATPARYRFVAASCGELWQGDACHGPKLFDPASGREVRTKIFGLIDDKSRLLTGLRAGFHETQQDFLTLLGTAVQRRGIPRAILLDNHGSFTGSDVRVACARLGIRLVHARPYDGASKGKIERLWRTLRAHVLDRLDPDRVVTLDDLNLRLWTWMDAEYNQRPHGGLSGRTPLSVWEDDVAEVRWIDDPAAIDVAFRDSIERKVRNDSTCSLRGRTYETPTHMRGRQVQLHFHLLDPARVWVMDGPTQVLLREVDAVGNSRRSRSRPAPEKALPPTPTGLNPVEDTLQRLLRPGKRRDDEQGEVSHA
jgi:transposase InsO family protein